LKRVNPYEEDLLHRIICGDEGAFAQLFDRYKDKLFAYGRKITKSEEVAEEIVQDVFLKIWTNRKKINPELAFDAYLFKITKNLALNFLQQAARDKKHWDRLTNYFQQLPERNSTEDFLVSAEYQRMLTEAVAQLPPRRKLVFSMSRQEGMTHAEIAKALKLSPGTVKIHIIHAVKSIKDYLRIHADITFLLVFLGGLLA
jgi:RNA polymerase sigma-70 factor (ECF subfamily)